MFAWISENEADRSRIRDRRARRLSWLVVALAALALAVSLAPIPPALAGVARLSGTMPAFGDVEDFRISSDSRYVVYLADQDADDVFALYSASLSGGVPIRLTPPGTPSLSSYQVSPDGSRVVYLAQQDTPGVDELYSVPIGGPAGAGVKLNRSLASGGQVHDMRVSPDGSRVVYLAAEPPGDTLKLYSVPIGGPASAGIPLAGPLDDGGVVTELFQISPDSRRVVFLARHPADTTLELYSVPVDGSGGVGKLNGQLVAGGSVSWTFAISPDSSRVVYHADQQVDNRFELYSVPIGGPASAGVKLNGSLIPGGSVDISFQISPDGARVIYQANQQADNRFELYSVPIAGPASAGVAVLSQGSAGYVQIGPDSQRVVYSVDRETPNTFELYSVPIDGPESARVKLNSPLVAGGNTLGFQISPDSARVVYRADQQVNDLPELYSVPVGGPASAEVRLNDSLPANSDVSEFQISPDGTYVIYSVYQSVEKTSGLYKTPIAGPASAAVPINDPLVAGGSTYAFQISRNSCYVIYEADQETKGVIELYAADLGSAVYLPLVRR